MVENVCICLTAWIVHTPSKQMNCPGTMVVNNCIYAYKQHPSVPYESVCMCRIMDFSLFTKSKLFRFYYVIIIYMTSLTFQIHLFFNVWGRRRWVFITDLVFLWLLYKFIVLCTISARLAHFVCAELSRTVIDIY